MGIVSIRPTGDQSEAFVSEGADPMGILLSLFRRDVFVRKYEFVFHAIMESFLPYIQRDFIPWFQVHQITEHFPFDVVVTSDNHVAWLPRVGRILVPPSSVIGHFPF